MDDSDKKMLIFVIVCICTLILCVFLAKDKEGIFMEDCTRYHNQYECYLMWRKPNA